MRSARTGRARAGEVADMGAPGRILRPGRHRHLDRRVADGRRDVPVRHRAGSIRDEVAKKVSGVLRLPVWRTTVPSAAVVGAGMAPDATWTW